MKKMISRIRQFFCRVKRTLDFIPIIWKGYDFDYRYAIELFQYQLKRTADLMKSDRAMTVNADVRAQRIETAIRLLEKVYNEEYGCEYQEKLEAIYGPSVLQFKFEPYGEVFELKWEYEYWDNAAEVEEVKDRLFKESQLKQRKAEKLVWEFISHNIRYWWD